MKLNVVLEKDEEDGGYVVMCPVFPGCVSQGETKAEALANIKDAIEGVLAVLNDRARRMHDSDQVVEVDV